jgi:hypothetical protein
VFLLLLQFLFWFSMFSGSSNLLHSGVQYFFEFCLFIFGFRICLFFEMVLPQSFVYKREGLVTPLQSLKLHFGLSHLQRLKLSNLPFFKIFCQSKEWLVRGSNQQGFAISFWVLGLLRLLLLYRWPMCFVLSVLWVFNLFWSLRA